MAQSCTRWLLQTPLLRLLSQHTFSAETKCKRDLSAHPPITMSPPASPPASRKASTTEWWVGMWNSSAMLTHLLCFAMDLLRVVSAAPHSSFGCTFPRLAEGAQYTTRTLVEWG